MSQDHPGLAFPGVQLRTTQRFQVPRPTAGMRRIVFTTNSAQGLANIRGPIVRAFVEAGFEVHILAPLDGYTQVFTSMGLHCHTLKMELYGRNPLSELALVSQLRSIYRRIKPDLIFHYTIKANLYGTLAAKSLGIPSVAVVPGLGYFPDEKNRIMRRLLNTGYATAARLSYEIWFANLHDFGFFEARGWLSSARARVLPGEGIDTSEFSLLPLPQNSQPRVLFIGRLLESKGVRTVYEAAKWAKANGLNISFELLGYLQEEHPDGISAEEIAAWVREGNIIYHGSTQDVRPFLAEIDMVVLPTFFREGMSCSIQEAMSCGRPVITTAVPGAGEMVEHQQTGYIVPIRNPDSIIEAIQYHMALSAEQKEAMSRRARATIVRKHDISQVHGHYFDVVSRLMA